MVMKNILCISLLVMFSLTGCSSMVTRNFVSLKTNIDEFPDNPLAQAVPVAMPYKMDYVRVYDESIKAFAEVPIDSLTREQIRKLLSNTSTKITIEKKDVDGSFNYIALGSNLQKGEYKITYDFTNSFNQIFEVKDGVKTTGEFGVGVRLIAEIKTSSKSVNVNGLIPLVISAKDKQLTGSIKYNTYGIKHPKIPTTAPATLNLSEDSIQRVFEAVAAARVLVELDETTLQPNLLSYVPILFKK
jgi:hypothetical protein